MKKTGQGKDEDEGEDEDTDKTMTSQSPGKRQGKARHGIGEETGED